MVAFFVTEHASVTENSLLENPSIVGYIVYSVTRNGVFVFSQWVTYFPSLSPFDHHDHGLRLKNCSFVIALGQNNSIKRRRHELIDACSIRVIVTFCVLLPYRSIEEAFTYNVFNFWQITKEWFAISNTSSDIRVVLVRYKDYSTLSMFCPLMELGKVPWVVTLRTMALLMFLSNPTLFANFSKFRQGPWRWESK